MKMRLDLIMWSAKAAENLLQGFVSLPAYGEINIFLIWDSDGKTGQAHYRLNKKQVAATWTGPRLYSRLRTKLTEIPHEDALTNLEGAVIQLANSTTIAFSDGEGQMVNLSLVVHRYQTGSQIEVFKDERFFISGATSLPEFKVQARVEKVR